MKRFVVSALAVLLWTGTALAASVTLQWDHSDPPSSIAGFRVYYGPTSRGNQLRPQTHVSSDPVPYAGFMVVDPAERTKTIGSLSQGQRYFFSATAFSPANTESDYSNEIAVDIPAIPGKPVNLQCAGVVDDVGRILVNCAIEPPQGTSPR